MSAHTPRKRIPRRNDTARDAGAFPTRLLALLPRAAVLLLAVFGFLFSLLTGYALTVQVARVVVTAFLFIALFTAAWASRHSAGWLLGALLLSVVFLLWRADELLQGALLLIEQALTPLSLYLPDPFLALLSPHDAEDALALATAALQALLLPVAFLTSYFTLRRASLFGLALSTLPLLLPLPFYSLSPGVVPFFCLVAAFFVLFIGNLGKRVPLMRAPSGKASETGNAAEDALPSRQTPFPPYALSALPLILLTALLAGRMLPEKDYVRPEKIQALQEKILSLDIGENPLARSNDGLTHGNLRNLSAIRFTGETALAVRVSENRALYLRDFAGVRFTGDSWTNAQAADYARYADAFSALAPQNLRATALANNATYTLSVKNVAAAGGSLWIPNGLATKADDIAGAAYVQDTAMGVASGARIPAYTVTAVPCDAALADVPLPNGGTNAESLLAAYIAAGDRAAQAGGGADAPQTAAAATAYIHYIFEAYTALSEETRTNANRLCEAYGLALSSENGALSLYDTCRDLYTLLTSRCTYAYAPPRVPKGADFTTYFLTESRSGYCVHFATAATVLLRSLGIPARYAEGYIVIRQDYDKQPDSEGFIPIEDTHAHAWVEVFDPAALDWIPVEMTASTGNDGAPAPESGITGEQPPAPTATPSPSPSPTPTSTPPDDSGLVEEQDAFEEPEPSAEPDPADEPDSADESEPSPEPEPDPAQAELPQENPTPSPDPAGNPGDAQPPPPPALQPLRSLLWLLLLVVGLPLAGIGAREIVRARRKRAFLQPDANEAVFAMTRVALRMLRFAGFMPLMPDQAPEAYAAAVSDKLPRGACERLRSLLLLAQRARFSGRRCTKRERAEAIAFVNALADTLAAGLPRVRRALCKYLFPTV